MVSILIEEKEGWIDRQIDRTIETLHAPASVWLSVPAQNSWHTLSRARRVAAPEEAKD